MLEATLVYEGDDRKREIELADTQASSKLPNNHDDTAQIKVGHFRYADSLDVLLMVIGTFGAAGNGILITLFSLFFGDLVDSFAGDQIVLGNDIDSKGIEDSVNRIAYRFAALTGAGFIAAYLEVSFWSIAGHRQARKAREHFMKSLMRRDMSYFDCHEAGAVTTNSVRATQDMQRALGEKVGSVVHFTCTFLSSVALGFYLGWQLSLLILGCVPLLAASIIFLEITQKRASKLKTDAYGDAGTIAEQCLSSIRTVKQSGGEAVETDRYSKALQAAESAAIRGGVYAGCGFGVMSGTILAFFGLSLWFGGWLVARGETNSSNGSTWSAGDVVAVLFAQILGAMALGQIQPPMSAVLQGRIASRTVADETSIISTIDPLADQSHIGPSHIEAEGNSAQAHAELRSVWFNYPSRPDVPILRGLSLSIPAGKTVALVGESGCGKSTVIQLLLRFYDPAEGTVLLDGIDIKSVGVAWLRKQIGLVSQEPVLFATTIAENIKFGKCYEATSDSEVSEAAIAANAHEFINRLPKGYDTLCGERGAQLSGGQKQRIAIARALVRKPRMLLLDEATSALDVKSERVVQEALDSARQGRTTLVIAHRLSTIRYADFIMSLRNGVVAESGSHDQLMEHGGIYAEMVHRQQISTESVQECEKTVTQGTSTEPAATESANGLIESRISTSLNEKLESDGSFVGSHLPLDESTVNAGEKDAGVLAGDAAHPHDGDLSGDDDRTHRPSARKLFAESWPEAHWVLLGTIFAGAYGAEYPIFSLLFGRAIGELQAAKGRGEVTGAVGVLAGSMFAVGVACGFCVFCQNVCFAMVGERLTTRLRFKSFKALVRRRVPFFDDTRNGSALLCSRLATEAAEVRGAAAERLGLVAQNLLTALLGAGIALASSWKLGLVTLACVPLMTVGSLIENKLYRGGFEEIGSDEAGELLGQAVQNARTVAAYGLEKSLLEETSKRLDRVMAKGIRLAHGSGIAYGFSQGIQYAIYGLGFWYGGRLLLDGEWDRQATANAAECASLIQAGDYPNEHVCSAAINFSYGFGRFMEAFFAVLLACWGVGEALSFAPDATKALAASAKIFRMIESTHEEMEDPDWPSHHENGGIGSSNTENSSSSLVSCFGQIEFKDIFFRYPARPEVQVLRGLSLIVPAGKTIALVGESGCGKSTLIQLVLRFYDPESGAVMVDGTNINDLGVAWLRRQIGLVAQEPVLFGTTVRANIAYGRLWDPPTVEEVESAAKAANAHEFLSKLPQGYDTLCGERGAQLSGGQKQRIAIARALVRKPRMLLLDEATSALDTASERVVQEALDSARQGRTTLVIAHRLSTVRDADIIAAVKDGIVAETGSHDELSVRPDSVYASLLRASGAAAMSEAEVTDSAKPEDILAQP